MQLLSIIAAEETSGGSGIFSIGLLLLIPVAMYFLLIRPQRKRQRAQQELQSSLDVGDEVMTASGIYGFITGFEDDKVWVEIDDDVQIRVNRGFLQGRVSAATGTTGSGSSAPATGSSSDAKVTPTVKGRKSGGGKADADSTTADAAADPTSGE